jgi:hypothetical protein
MSRCWRSNHPSKKLRHGPRSLRRRHNLASGAQYQPEAQARAIRCLALGCASGRYSASAKCIVARHHNLSSVKAQRPCGNNRASSPILLSGGHSDVATDIGGYANALSHRNRGVRAKRSGDGMSRKTLPSSCIFTVAKIKWNDGVAGGGVYPALATAAIGTLLADAPRFTPWHGSSCVEVRARVGA